MRALPQADPQGEISASPNHQNVGLPHLAQGQGDTDLGGMCLVWPAPLFHSLVGHRKSPNPRAALYLTQLYCAERYAYKPSD